MYSLKQLNTFIYISAIVALCLFDSVDIKICISGGIELTKKLYLSKDSDMKL